MNVSDDFFKRKSELMDRYFIFKSTSKMAQFLLYTRSYIRKYIMYKKTFIQKNVTGTRIHGSFKGIILMPCFKTRAKTEKTDLKHSIKLKCLNSDQYMYFEHKLRTLMGLKNYNSIHNKEKRIIKTQLTAYN